MKTSHLFDTCHLLVKVKPVFARHETFHPRFGWLKKGIDAAFNDSGIFLQADATVRLGVGKNMVRSIRYWCSAFKILEDDKPTDFGTQLFKDDGWDPFLENPASLWLLHWNLLKPSCRAAAWYFTFHIFRQVEFTFDELLKSLNNYKTSLGSRVAESSLEKDITCILRMYVEQGAKVGPGEDSIDCPFSELGIIQLAGGTKRYSFQVGRKDNLPPEIIVAACLEFASWKGEQKTISISSLVYDEGSPGLAFKLSESAVCDAISSLENSQANIRLSDTAGLVQFSFFDRPIDLANAILDKYYKTRPIFAQ